MKKQFTSERFREAYTSFRVAAIVILVLATLFITVKGCAFVYDVELSIPERMTQERDYNDHKKEREQERSRDRVNRDDNPTQRDYENCYAYEQDRMV